MEFNGNRKTNEKNENKERKNVDNVWEQSVN